MASIHPQWDYQGSKAHVRKALYAIRHISWGVRGQLDPGPQAVWAIVQEAADAGGNGVRYWRALRQAGDAVHELCISHFGPFEVSC